MAEKGVIDERPGRGRAAACALLLSVAWASAPIAAQQPDPPLDDAEFERALPPLEETAAPLPPKAPETVPSVPELAQPLPPLATFDATPAPSITADAGGEPRQIPYTVQVEGLKPLGLEDDFRALSALLHDGKKAANATQIGARAEEDKALAERPEVLAAYAMARREFPGKRLAMLIFLLPLLVPPITYGIPMATVLYQLNLAGTFWGVVLANLVPTIPFVVLVMIPFIEQIDPRIEAAARVFGASTPQLFVRVLFPLLLPGMLAAMLLVLVRTIAMFELTFLTAGPTSQTLVVALYYAVFAAGVRANQSIDAMAVVYMVVTLIWLVIALRFVNPTQIVARAKQQSAH